MSFSQSCMSQVGGVYGLHLMDRVLGLHLALAEGELVLVSKLFLLLIRDQLVFFGFRSERQKMRKSVTQGLSKLAMDLPRDFFDQLHFEEMELPFPISGNPSSFLLESGPNI